jgi:hypothetical protein
MTRIDRRNPGAWTNYSYTSVAADVARNPTPRVQIRSIVFNMHPAQAPDMKTRFLAARWIMSAVVAALLSVGLRAQLTLSSLDSSFNPAWVGDSVALGDVFDGSANLDSSKQSSLSGSSASWDLIGTAAQGVIQLAEGNYNFGGSVGTANAFLFRVRLAAYNKNGPGSGSVIVLFSNGNMATSYGIAVSFNNTAGTTPSGFEWVSPNAGTSLNSSFSYTTTSTTAGNFAGTYFQATSLAGTYNVTFPNYSGNDAYMTFAVLASDLSTRSGGTFAINTPLTLFTNNNTNLSQINGDWIGVLSGSADLQLASVPEISTWMQFGTLAGIGGIGWWRRRNQPKEPRNQESEAHNRAASSRPPRPPVFSSSIRASRLTTVSRAKGNRFITAANCSCPSRVLAKGSGSK